jgi:hypothetical protein
MSTVELGISLAEMIRRDKVHLIVSTVQSEEDIFNPSRLTTTSACRITGSHAEGR